MRNTPKQDLVVYYVSKNPDCAKIDPARYVAPNGSLKYGYQTVNRAIKNGKIHAVRSGSKYILTVVQVKGTQP